MFERMKVNSKLSELKEEKSLQQTTTDTLRFELQLNYKNDLRIFVMRMFAVKWFHMMAVWVIRLVIKSSFPIIPTSNNNVC